jgi:hypothetical protein
MMTNVTPTDLQKRAKSQTEHNLVPSTSTHHAPRTPSIIFFTITFDLNNLNN